MMATAGRTGRGDGAVPLEGDSEEVEQPEGQAVATPRGSAPVN